ncbi:MAG: M24 family metallopeptidase [Candidatus Glassbacteria bacterium]|nr:M24 family metallopeptidase [Candidatus Glassbacteria bacterium]
MLRIAAMLSAVTLMLICSAAGRAEILPTGGRDLLNESQMVSMQAYMLEKRFDGWVFSGQGTFDDPEKEFLGLNGQTRWRWVIFYPALATLSKPYLVYHRDDEPVFSGINFYPLPYRSRDEMLSLIKDNFSPVAKKICLNYSHQLQIPELSRIDGGLLELLVSQGFEVISSGSILSFFNTRWRTSDVETHKQAAARLDSLRPGITAYLSERVSKGKKVTDYDLVKYIGKQLKKLGLEEKSAPAVAVGENTLLEHYVPDKKKARPVARGDLIYVEVSARLLKKPESMYARLGWTFLVEEEVPDSLAENWNSIVASAEEALAILNRHLPKNKSLRGYQVDQAARGRLGGNPHLLPRPLGSNLNPYDHHFGVRFDSYLAYDDREIMPGMGFTLEPGLYFFKNHYALRMCANLVTEGDSSIYLSAPLQQAIEAVLANTGLR